MRRFSCFDIMRFWHHAFVILRSIYGSYLTHTRKIWRSPTGGGHRTMRQMGP